MKRSSTIRAMIALLSALSLGGCHLKKAPQMGAPELPVFTATECNIPREYTFVGRTCGERDLLIQPRVEGVITHIYFREGSYVKGGTPLYLIEPATYNAQVDQYRAEVERAEATLTEARKNYNRIKPLSELSATSQSTLDEATAQLQSARAALKEAKAILTQSTITAGYTQICAPCSGIIGRTLAERGDLVGLSTAHAKLNTISQIDNIKVLFYLPGTLYQELTAAGRKFSMEGITLSLSDRSSYPHSGTLDFVGRAVESSSGSFQAQASFPNPEHLLRPGEFARIRAVIDTLYNVVLIPQKAVQQTQTIFNVWVLDSLNRASQRIITPAHTQGSDWVITRGLHAGDRIITEGFHKLKEGIQVKPIASTKADHTPAPTSKL